MNAQKSINGMSEAGKLAKREYAKRWRAKNREKVRQYNYAYWNRRAQNERATQQDAASIQDSV